MNINTKMKDEIWGTLKRFLPMIIALTLVVMAAFLILSSCKPKTAEKGDAVISEEGGAISEPQKDYDAWEYRTVSAKCGVDRQSGDVICTRIKNGDASQISNFLAEHGKDGWQLVDALTTDDVSTFIFKRLK